MALKTPSFWWGKANWKAAALAPVAALYAHVAGSRLRNAARLNTGLPVLCVGNFTVGGSGKTPVAIALAQAARERSFVPGILSRGHGRMSSEPRIVDLARDAAETVGDEPLLLAAAAEVAVSGDRARGAKLLRDRGCDFLIMDDGFQSAQVRFDHAVIVVDARYGAGNGLVLPAGPLRARISDQMPFASSFLAVGDGQGADQLLRDAAAQGKPVARASMRALHSLSGRRFYAFAGIGHPEKFFRTIAIAQGVAALTRGFPDHHAYSDQDLADIASTARAADLDIITTAKDAVRIGRAKFDALAPGRTHVLEIEASFEDPRTPGWLIDQTVAAWLARKV